jgi:hypothetical protein
VSKFYVEMNITVPEEHAHLMNFFHSTLKAKLADTKISIDSVQITEVEEPNS